MPTDDWTPEDRRDWPTKVYRGSFGFNARLRIEAACTRKRRRAVFLPVSCGPRKEGKR